MALDKEQLLGPDDAIAANIVCPCHHSGTCNGAMQLVFPVRMFEPLGEIEYRQQRNQAVRNFLQVWDEMYERCRRDLHAKDPLVMRPMRLGRQVVILDTEGIKDATEPGGGNGKDKDA